MTTTDTDDAIGFLREKLPHHLRTTPFIVQSHTGELEGVAFCTSHPTTGGGYWDTRSCMDCTVIDALDTQVAQRIVALLRAASPLAAHLNAIDAWDHRPEQDHPDGPWRCDACGELGRQPMRCPAFSAADVTQAINQAVTR